MYAYADKYKVSPRDTLYGIARRNGFSVAQLLRINLGITDPDLIYAGQFINIPKVVPMTTYFVKPGDTLWRIVFDYNKDLMRYYGIRITLDEVLAYNPKITDPDLIYPGEVIYLPEIL